jgi:hypothetical protein
VPSLTHHLTGKLFGDEGCIGEELVAQLLRRGSTLLTRMRENMNAPPRSMTDKMLLNARNMAETIISHIKAFSSLNLSIHRAPVNAFLHLLAALTPCQINPIKPNASFFPLHSLPA